MSAAMPSKHGGALKLHRRATSGEVSSLQPQQQTSKIGLSIPIGTAGAISNIIQGVPALSAKRLGRGGARNRSDRESHALTAAQVANLLAAERHASSLDLPFTRMMTIHWEAAGVALEGMAKATGRFTGLLAKALARHGSRTAWIWVHENGLRKGGHCHLLAHVPPVLVPTLAGLQRGWLRRISARPYRERVIYSEPIGGRLGLEQSNPELHVANLQAVLGYILKGASPAAATLFELTRVEPGGHIIGKRCGTSQNISAKARNRKV